MTNSQKLELSREIRQWIKVGGGIFLGIVALKNSELDLQSFNSFDISRIIKALKGDN